MGCISGTLCACAGALTGSHGLRWGGCVFMRSEVCSTRSGVLHVCHNSNGIAPVSRADHQGMQLLQAMQYSMARLICLWQPLRCTLSTCHGTILIHLHRLPDGAGSASVVHELAIRVDQCLCLVSAGLWASQDGQDGMLCAGSSEIILSSEVVEEYFAGVGVIRICSRADRSPVMQSMSEAGSCVAMLTLNNLVSPQSLSEVTSKLIGDWRSTCSAVRFKG